VFSLLMSLKMVPYWQSKYRFEPVAVDGHAVTIAWASDDGSATGNIPVSAMASFDFNFPWLNMQRQVEKSAVKVVVKAKLPQSSNYVLKLTGKAETVTLPLALQNDGSYSTPAFIALEAGETGNYFHGVRVFHVTGTQCLLAVERVVEL
jgi:hypothetical protein